MLTIYPTRKYEKSLKKYIKTEKFSISRLEKVVLDLQKRIPLDKKYQDHPLKGRLKNLRERHIYPDILLLYEIYEDKLILILVDIGSHSELL